MPKHYDVIIVGSGPAGLGAAFYLAEQTKKSVLIIDKARICSGGLRHDCKQNYTYPVGFPTALWSEEEASELLQETAAHLKPTYQPQKNLEVYFKRAERLGVHLLQIKQAHVGTDKAVALIKRLMAELQRMNIDLLLQSEVSSIDYKKRTLTVKPNSVHFTFGDLAVAPGRSGADWLQRCMKDLDIDYTDNVVDVGIRLEAHARNYGIVKDYYDPKFLFPDDVRTFCTNSGAAHVVQEKYETYISVNGHSFSEKKRPNGLVNFSLLKTITLTDPVASGHAFARILGQMAMNLGGGKPLMQRVGDFRLGKRSKRSTFNDDLYHFKPTLRSATPGDVSLAMPAKILRDIWKSTKTLDTIVPGVLHPSTVIYYPEIKTYASKPRFVDSHFRVKDNLYFIGDGAGTSRGVTAAWASGIRAAQGIAPG